MRARQQISRLPALLTLWLLWAGSSFPAFGQSAGELADQRLIQVQAITAEIIKEEAVINSDTRALIRARLGEIFWPSDQEKARAFFTKAVEEVESKSDQADSVNDQRHITTIRNLLTIISARDSELSERLMKLVGTDLKKVDEYGNNSSAQALLEAALAIVKENPRKAAALGSASLRLGHSYMIEPLLFRLRARDTTQMEKLFNEALATARIAANNDLLFSLMVVAFPEALTPPLNVPRLPDRLRIAFLAVLAERLLRVPVSLGDEAGICKLAASTIHLLNKFSALLPQHSDPVRQRMSTCQSFVGARVRQYMESSLRGQSSELTVDDYLKRADQAEDTKTRAEYLFEAVILEEQQGEIDRAIALLDSMSSDEREGLGDRWDNIRLNLAVTSAYHQIKRENYIDMQRILSAVPSKLRPFAQTSLARRVRNFKDKNIALELVREARSSFSKSEISDSDKIAIYFWQGLIELYSSLAPDEALAVFHESIRTLNHASAPVLPDNALPGGKSDHDSLVPLNLPRALLGFNGISARQEISTVQDTIVRVRLRLGLLRSLLQQYRSEQASERRNKNHE